MRQNYYFGYLENLFSKVDDRGRLKITEDLTYLGQEGKKSKAEKIQELIEQLEGFHLFDVAISNKSLLKRIDLVLEETANTRSVEFDVFTLLGITKKDVPQQIEEIQNFWREVKLLMLPHLEAYPMLRTFNHRGKSKKTSYELNLCKKGEKAGLVEAYSQEEIKRIQDLAANSEAVHEMFTQAALNLNKVGPYSTAVIRYSDILNDEELRTYWMRERDPFPG